MKPSTGGSEINYESLETLPASPTKPNVLEYLQSSGQLSVLQLLMQSICSQPKVQFSFSQAIKLKGSSGTLSITWAPTESPRRGAKRERLSNKSSTSDTL